MTPGLESAEPLLRVENVRKHFPVTKGILLGRTVGHVKARTGDFTVGDGGSGPVSMRLREALLDIQHGRVADTHGWLHRVA